MIFRSIDFHLRSEENNIAYNYDLKKKSRHIFNYIERNCLKQLKFETINYSGIIIDLRYGYEDRFIYNIEPSLSPTKCIVCVLPFNKSKYDNLKTDDEFRYFFYECLLEAFKQVNGKFIIPEKEILDSYQALKCNDFLNEWLHKKKIDKKRKIEVKLICILAIDKFQLRFIVTLTDEVVFDEIVLETEADEVAFYWQFKDILIEETKIIITKKYAGNLLEYSLNINQITTINIFNADDF